MVARALVISSYREEVSKGDRQAVRKEERKKERKKINNRIKERKRKMKKGGKVNLFFVFLFCFVCLHRF